MPLPIDDPRQRRPDLARAAEVLKWIPSVALDDGLPPTIKHFEQIWETLKYSDIV
jgi:UDP-glucuronate decarboxylase